MRCPVACMKGGTVEQLRELVSKHAVLTAATLATWRARWQSDSGPADDWPDPAPIQGELPTVQRFDEDLIPVSFRRFVRDVAVRMQVPIDYPGIVAVLALAGAVNRRAVTQPKENDTAWVVVPNLWGRIVAPPGFMKSPVIQTVVRPLIEIQQDWPQFWAHFRNGNQKRNADVGRSVMKTGRMGGRGEWIRTTDLLVPNQAL